MPIETFIERWFAFGLLVFGLSHLLHPVRWAAFVQPLQQRESGAFLVGLFNLPLGLAVVLGHNVWVWGITVIVTVLGWSMILKGVAYLLFPRAISHVMPTGERMVQGFRGAGVVCILLGALLIYHSFYQR
jgi:predicted phage tail protein